MGDVFISLLVQRNEPKKHPKGRALTSRPSFGILPGAAETATLLLAHAVLGFPSGINQRGAGGMGGREAHGSGHK